MQNFQLRGLMLQDAPLMLEWMHDRELVSCLSANFLDKTTADCEKFIIDASKTYEKWQQEKEEGYIPENLHLAITDEEDTYLGTVSLKHIQRMRETFVKEKPLKEDPLKEDPLKEDPLKEDPLKEDLLKEDSLKEDPIKEASIKEASETDTSVIRYAEFGIAIRRAAMKTNASFVGMEKILELAYENLGIRQVFWCVDPMNLRALRFYDKHGYQRVSAELLENRIVGYSSEQIQRYVWYLTSLEGADSKICVVSD